MRLLLHKKHFLCYVFFIFLCIFFLANQCSSLFHRKQSFPALTQEEKKDLDYLFRVICFENYGAFVLFGSKPLCEMTLFDPIELEIEQTQWIAAMTKKEREEWERMTTNIPPDQELLFERNPYHCWLTWKKIHQKLKTPHYLFALIPQKSKGKESKGSYVLIFAHIEKTKQVLLSNYALFRKAVGFDFDPSQVIKELENPSSTFWKQVFSVENPITQGLLFGFGNENVFLYSYFDEKARFASVENPVEFGKANIHNFTIPLFGVSDLENETLQTYKKEKTKIEEIYRGKDLVEVTLSRLSES